jgi:hypothetical protein
MTPYVPYRLEVFHPGQRHPVLLVQTHIDPWPSFAVYRPAYSARGGCRNARRLLRPNLAGAFALAMLPLKQSPGLTGLRPGSDPLAYLTEWPSL